MDMFIFGHFYHINNALENFENPCCICKGIVHTKMEIVIIYLPSKPVVPNQYEFLTSAELQDI